MKLSAIARETALNLLSGTARWILWSVLLSAFACGFAAIDAHSSTTILADAQAFKAAGANIVVVRAEGMIDGAICDSAAARDGVASSGALRTTDYSLSNKTLPGSSIPTFEATPGLLPLLAGHPVGGEGVALSRSAATTFGAEAGDRIAFQRGNTVVSSTFDYPADGRWVGLEYSVIVPTISTDGHFDECWIKGYLDSTILAPAGALSIVADGPEEVDVVISQLNPSLGKSYDALQLYAKRPTQSLGLGLLIAGAIMGLASVRIRRLQLAGNLHAGMSIRALVLQTFLEALAICISSFAISLGPLALIAQSGAAFGEFWALLGNALVMLGLASVGLTAGATLTCVQLRENQLFKYFKER